MQSNERIKALVQSVSNASDGAICILPHCFPDGDTLGSAIAVCEWLKHHNKKGYIVLEDAIPSNLLFLFDGLEKPMTVEAAKSKEWALAIAVDCGETKLFYDRLDIYESAAVKVAIDHHLTHADYASLSIVDVSASSTGEIVAGMFESSGFPFNETTGKALYTAIVTDTGNFKYSNTKPSTFRVCAKLMESGFDFNAVNVALFQNKSFEKVTLLNKVFETLELHYDNRLAVVGLEASLMEKLGYDTYDTDGIVEFVRDIAGVEVVAFIRYIGGGSHKISMRSKNDIDVSAVAQAFSGGGHMKAAGFKSDNSFETIKAALISYFGDVFK